MLSVCFQRLESARKEKEEYERQAERERLEAIARDRQKMEEKVAEEKKLKDMLKEQMLELKAREIEVSRRDIYRPKTIICLFLNQSICCGYSKEPSQ